MAHLFKTVVCGLLGGPSCKVGPPDQSVAVAQPELSVCEIHSMQLDVLLEAKTKRVTALEAEILLLRRELAQSQAQIADKQVALVGCNTVVQTKQQLIESQDLVCNTSLAALEKDLVDQRLNATFFAQSFTTCQQHVQNQTILLEMQTKQIQVLTQNLTASQALSQSLYSSISELETNCANTQAHWEAVQTSANMAQAQVTTFQTLAAQKGIQVANLTHALRDGEKNITACQAELEQRKKDNDLLIQQQNEMIRSRALAVREHDECVAINLSDSIGKSQCLTKINGMQMEANYLKLALGIALLLTVAVLFFRRTTSVSTNSIKAPHVRQGEVKDRADSTWVIYLPQAERMRSLIEEHIFPASQEAVAQASKRAQDAQQQFKLVLMVSGSTPCSAGLVREYTLRWNVPTFVYHTETKKLWSKDGEVYDIDRVFPEATRRQAAKIPA